MQKNVASCTYLFILFQFSRLTTTYTGCALSTINKDGDGDQLNLTPRKFVFVYKLRTVDAYALVLSVPDMTYDKHAQGKGGAHPPHPPESATECNNPPINGQCHRIAV